MNTAFRLRALAAASAGALLVADVSAQTGPGAFPTADVVFVLDTSGSITPTEIDQMALAMSVSIGTVIPATVNYQVAVVGFDSTATTLLPLTPASDPGLAGSLLALGSTTPTGSTDMGVGLREAKDVIVSGSVATWRHVVVFTDAMDDQLSDSLATANDLRDRFNTRVSIGYLDSVCNLYQLIYECEVDVPPGELGIWRLGQIANAPDAPLFHPPRGNLLPGVLDCVLTNPEFDAFLADALCPLAAYATMRDFNNNEIPDQCDVFLDCDQNGVNDQFDPDCDGDGLPDACEPDCDADGIPDDCDPDADGDGVPDVLDSRIDCDNEPCPDPHGGGIGGAPGL